MAWDHLDINKPHLVYIILGGFTSLFMLCSSVIKERLYIGEATVATLCGIMFGPHAANLINPATWGNTDQITLEFSRIVLVVQCFAVGVELPKAYMERHWRSVVFLLVPVMTFGWLVTSLFIWATMFGSLNWLDCLCVSACVTATDPVLASSVVGKGKFAKRVPKHLRDLLSAESGCNDGMAFPFIYLAIYLIRYRPDANEVAFHWFCYTILYECIFGAIYGVLVGYAARRAIRVAHEWDLIDRESFLVFYFVLALFCAGSGSILGMDDLLIGFACGVGFSNDGWFLEKTEEAHVSNVIDLLINLAFFVYFGTIIPWEAFNSEIIGTSPWRLVVIALMVIFFRRIPIMLLLKPVIPDIKTWREALFAGHFGPIGVGALYVAILARAELETEGSTPLAVLPKAGFAHLNIIELIWPITTFLVITSIVVHGSSIAVFTLGKHINTLTITMSYTQGNEDGSWMERLPRIQSRSKSSMSLQRADSSGNISLDEKYPEYPSNALIPRNFLRRQKEDDSRPASRPSSRNGNKRRRWDTGLGPGGPISQSAISPQPLQDKFNGIPSPERTDSDTLAEQSSQEKKSGNLPNGRTEIEAHEEGHETVFEDGQGNVLEVTESKGESKEEREEHATEEVRRLMSDGEIEEVGHQKPGMEEDTAQDEMQRFQDLASRRKSESGGKSMLRKLSAWSGMTDRDPNRAPPEKPKREQPPGRKSGPARAFRFGRTIIVEDEDGEVIKKYEIPAPEKPAGERRQSFVDSDKTRQRLQRMGTWLGVGQGQDDDEEGGEASTPSGRQKSVSGANNNNSNNMEDDDRIRFTMTGDKQRMSAAEFIKKVQALDPKQRAVIVDDISAPEAVKQEARADGVEQDLIERRIAEGEEQDGVAELQRVGSRQDQATGGNGLGLAASNTGNIPFHSVTAELRRFQVIGPDTAAQQRRRQASQQPPVEEDSDDDGTARIPPARRGSIPGTSTGLTRQRSRLDEGETAAERRRREAALGQTREEDDSDEDETRPRQPPGITAPPEMPRPGIRFAEPSRTDAVGAKPSSSGMRRVGRR